MKLKAYLLLAAALALLCCCCTAAGEEPAACSIRTGEQWSWSRGAYNTFSGTIDLTGFSGGELTVTMTTDLEYDAETEQKSMPVFTTVNGKRIAMTKQSAAVKVTADPDNPRMEFTGSFRLPEKKRIEAVTFTFSIAGADGAEQKNVSCMIDSGKNIAGKKDNTFYIPVDIGRITLITGIAAAVVWALVLIRIWARKKSIRTGD